MMITIIVMNAIMIALTILIIIAEKYLVTYGRCRIIINGGDKVLEVAGGDTLMSYFNTNKIYIPSACGGKATCGFCKVKVLSGAGQILPTEEVYIKKEEQKEGYRLSCQVKVRQDLELFIPEYLLEAKEYGTSIKNIADVTHDIKWVTFEMDNDERLKFKPGQYIQFKIPGTDEFRAYSVASSPVSDKSFDLTVRLVKGGLCSTYIHEALDTKDKIMITGPFGDFFLREDSDREIICIAGGCGMAPIRSILYYLASKGMPRKVKYFFGARSKQDLFFTGELTALSEKYANFQYIPALSEPKNDDKWQGEVGLITAVVERFIDNAGGSEAYLCGPPPMIDASVSVLTKKGMKAENIFFDKF